MPRKTVTAPVADAAEMFAAFQAFLAAQGQGTAQDEPTPAKATARKASPAKVSEPTVPTLLRWRGNVAAKPGADFRHTVKRTGESATYHRATLAEAKAMLDAAYAAGAFYAYRVG